MPEERDQVQQLEPRFYPNLMGRLMLLSLEDVMGRNGVSALLNLANQRHLVQNYPPNNLRREFPFVTFGAITAATTTMYGPRGARGMELRAGRYAFNLGVREFGPLLGMADLALKLMPLTMKVKIALNGIAQTFDRFSDQPSHVEEQKNAFLYVIEKCPVCWGRHSEAPCCFWARGVIEEGLEWVSGGHTFRVEEIACRAAGDSTCTFRIDKDPVE